MKRLNQRRRLKLNQIERKQIFSIDSDLAKTKGGFGLIESYSVWEQAQWK